ncbi:MAG TPA: insulinase family protein [Saprospiraceae bacterium]|nr:insulinase family protein [Saprospiraceae bacterium]HMP24246.1 insulinase family protein [Saprospiraceae bacterium]
MIEIPVTNYTYQTVPNDPFAVKTCKLSNGLTLMLSVNKEEPRIFTNIVVRSGSKQDPADATGLAHYMEHMLFKGTSKIGTLDWDTEKVLLQRISDLYEQYRATEDEAARKEIYAEIDRVSSEAALLVAPNEYDKLASSIGAKDTNAYTWLEQTVYVNDIPANELEHWMELESERFRMLALRLFHTELETVYEEFNISQDRDGRKVSNTIRSALFPKHPYGTQTTLGSARHLKNPSHVKIQEYFSTYYVPNNMGIVLTGDFDPDEAVALAERYFGSYQPKPVPPFTFEAQPPIEQPIVREAFGQESPFVQIAWRFGGSQSNQSVMLLMLHALLYNSQAGLLDIHLNQQQQVLDSEAWQWQYEDYAVLGLHAEPRAEQTLEETGQLLLQMVEKLKAGDFEDWLLEAVVKSYKLDELSSIESNRARAHAMTHNFILGIEWERYVRQLEDLEKITKQQVVNFAQTHLRDNFVMVYKRQGDDPNIVRVEKPEITPVALNRNALSDFAVQFLSKEAPRLQPFFPNFSDILEETQLQNGIELSYVRNEQNPLFRLDYIFEMGKNSDRSLALALQYLPYLGTNRYTPTRLQQEFFRLGLVFDVHIGDERSYVSLAGLEESFEEGIQLMEHILAEVQGDADALQKMVSDILRKRANAKQDRGVILREALGSYARYGADSPFTFRIPAEQLTQITPDELVSRIRSLCSYQHNIYYYGQQSMTSAACLIEKYHRTPETLQPVLPARSFQQIATDDNRVLFLEFPMVQSDILLVSRGTPYFNLEEHIMRELYNEYFGYGLSSIVFQEIRESKALAYATYAYYTSPRKKDMAHYLQAYVGTQPDKIPDAVPAMLRIIEQMPLVEGQIANARTAILKQMESERLTRKRVFWESMAAKDLGVHRNLASEMYEMMQQADAATLAEFHSRYIQGRKFSLVVLGQKAHTDLDYLADFGPLQELSMEHVFGY